MASRMLCLLTLSGLLTMSAAVMYEGMAHAQLDENGHVRFTASHVTEYQPTREEEEKMLLDRQKRDVLTTWTIDDADIAEFEHWHEYYRKIQGSSNMYYLYWNDTLADYGQDYGNTCKWGHDQPDRDDAAWTNEWIGQNLYFRSGDYEISYAHQRWHDEIEDYVYDTQECTGSICGHYTQLTWAYSQWFGCTKLHCANLIDKDTSFDYGSAYMTVCNYGPGGNAAGMPPFLKGDNCTECDNDIFWCYDGLCRDCKADGITDQCECADGCVHGTPDPVTCTCQSCDDGWRGDTCEDVCENINANCGTVRGWKEKHCTTGANTASIQFNCPLMCGLCVEGSGTTTGAPLSTTTAGAPPSTTTAGAPPSTTTAGDPPSTTTAAANTGSTTTTAANTGSTTTTAANTGSTSTAAANSGSTSTAGSSTTAADAMTSTTTSTTTTTTTATPLTAPSGGTCDGWTCYNGASLLEDPCQCVCTTGYQGEECSQNTEEAASGVELQLAAELAQWSDIEPVVLEAFAEAVNDICKQDEYFGDCCPGSSALTMAAQQTYVDVNNVVLGTGYPTMDSEVLLALMYIELPESSEFCGDSGAGRRRKRSLADIVLPQAVLYEAIASAQVNLTVSLSACCDVNVIAFEKGQNKTGWTYYTEVSDGGMDGWLIAVIVLCCLVPVIILVVVVILVLVMPGKRPTSSTKIAIMNEEETPVATEKAKLTKKISFQDTKKVVDLCATDIEHEKVNKKTHSILRQHTSLSLHAGDQVTDNHAMSAIQE